MIKKILVSQPKPTSEKSPYFDIEAKENVEFTFHPFIKSKDFRHASSANRRCKYSTTRPLCSIRVMPSTNFFTLCKEMRIALPEDMKYFGISETVALYIQKYVQYRKRKVSW